MIHLCNEYDSIQNYIIEIHLLTLRDVHSMVNRKKFTKQYE